MAEKLMNDKELAEMLEIGVQTLRNMRARRQGPPYIKIGRRTVRYREADVEKFLSANTITPPNNLRGNAMEVAA
jgi:predicted DNA-binding transcriptional regulator AlpA